MRHLVLAAAFAVLAVLPLAERLVPSIGIPVDSAVTAPLLPITRVDTAADLAGPAATAPAARRSSSASARPHRRGRGSDWCLPPGALVPFCEPRSRPAHAVAIAPAAREITTMESWRRAAAHNRSDGAPRRGVPPR